MTVNPEILRWARETAGLTVEEACKKLNIKDTEKASATQILLSYENGKKEPSRSMLEKMEKQYHRPMIVFFMNYVPRPANRGEDFRTLSESYSSKDAALVDALVRDITVKQKIIKASLEDEDEEVKALHYVHSIKQAVDVEGTAAYIRNEFNIDLQRFYRKVNPESAFAYLREKAEDKRVFVLLLSNLGSYHSQIDLAGFRGFSIADEIAPFIVINEQDAKGALSFTLIHELTHICLGQTGISNNNSTNEIEGFCDAVASECLLPVTEMAELTNLYLDHFEEWQEAIDQFVKHHNVSHSMVVFRLHELGKIDQRLFESLLDFYKERWFEWKNANREKMKQQEGGPTYYVTQRYKMGKNLLNTVNRLITAGTLSTSKARIVLGMKYDKAFQLLSRI